MNGYNREKIVSTTRTRSMDYCDLSSLSKTPKPVSNPPDSNKISNEKKIPDEKIKEIHAPAALQNEDEEDSNVGGEIFGVILNRKYGSSSVSSKSSPNYYYYVPADDQRESASLQSAVKRVFSMRRSSSVSEGYCRIHHQCDPTAAASDAADDGTSTFKAFKKRSMKKEGKIFRACRRLFGF